MAENIFSLGQLEDRLVEKGLGEMLSGEYLEKNVSKQFAAEDKRTLNAAVEMARRGVKHSLSLGLARVEKAAKDKGFSVGFSFNEKTNEVDVILYEGKTQQEINAQSKKEFLDFKAEMPHFRIAIGTPTKGTKYRMPSTKALAAHIDNEGAYFTTELEDVLEGVADKISSSKRYKGQSGENFKRRVKSAVKRGKESAVKSIISTEAYSIVDDEKYYEELRHQQSAARDTFLQTDVKTAGILGEVAKKLDLTRTIKKARSLTNKQVESYNRRIDNLLTKYQITYQTLGKQAAENLMKNADIWSELMIEEKQVDKILSDTEKYFGSFLQMRGQIGLSSDEAMQRKTMSFAGQRDVALRGKVETNRHPSQARNYLRRKDQTVRRRTEMVIPAAMKDEMDYFSGSDKQLYKKALVTSEADIYDAYIGAIDDAIKEELKKLRGQKANKGVSEEDLQKMAEERVRKNLPVIAPSVLDDMGIISASAAKSLDSVRTVAKNITKDEYNKLNAEATKKWQKLIDSGKTPKMPQDEYISNYIAKKATGRSKLSDVSINIGENGGVDISALEDVKFGGQAKTLDYNENLRETKQVLPDNIVKLMAQRLGISGAVDMIGRAKSVKASEIPQYVQMILTTWAIENGLDANGINQLAINILGKAVVQGATEDGKLIIDNARDLWDNYDWDSALNRMVEIGMIHKTASGYSLGKTGDKAFSLYDVVNVADVWNSTKDVKTSYKESSGVFRDIQSMSTRAQSDGEKKAFNELNKEVKAMYDPMTGSGADEAKKAKEDIDKILNEKTGSIVKTYESKKDEDREKSVRRLKKEHYDPNKKFKKKKTYLVTIGPGTDYTIDTNTLMQDVDYSKGDGMLTEEEYQKTALGRIEQITNDIQSKAGADANIEYVIDPGTDFGFSMSFGEDGKEEGATGRFVVLPNIQTNYRVNEQGEKLYSLPEYAKDISSLVGAINIPGSNLAGEKAQELTKSIFTAANYGKSSLRQAAETKRIGGSKSVHPIGISNEQIERLMLGSEEDKKRATELISSIYVSRELAKEMLSDKTRFIDKNKKYDSSVHENAINEALKYAGVDLSTLSDSTIDQKIDVLLDSITEGDGRAVKGISSIINRYPSISKHSAAFASVKIDPSMTGLQMKVGPGLMKFMNGDYDGDTVNLILGLWGSGYSIEAAAEMVERQRRINERVYKKMSAAEKAKSGDELTMISGSDVGKNADFLNLSALATKFNKPYTGLFSNISTKIREGLNASGYDYDILTNESSDTDYIKVIQGELVSVVGQILEQDSISAKKVEKRIQKERDTLDRELTQEEKNLEQQTVLTEFENLDKMLRDPQFSFSEIIDKMKEMELFSDDVSQISSVITSVIESLTENLGDKRKESIYQRLGLNEADLEKGVLNADAIKKAGSSIEYATGMKIFGGEYGKGFATSREFTPHMKNDEYQLLKFVKSVDEANNVLKTMGELIDENGNRFSQYGEKIRGAMGVLKLEAGQEAAKTIIAGKENKAISALAVSYGGLASEVEGLKEIGASKGWNTVTGFASQLAPFGRMGTDAGYGNIFSRLDRIFANQNDSDEFISMSQEERARRFGYGNDVKSFEKERGTVLSSIYGTAAHSISQILSEASQKYGEDILNLDALKKIGDQELINQYQKALDVQEKKMRILGFSEDEIQKQSFKTSYSGERNFESLLNLVGGEKGKRFVNLGKPEQSIVGENALGEKLYGQIDATYISKYLDQSGAEKSIFNVVDYKNLSGEIKPENVIQVLTYIALLRQLKAEVQKMKSEGMSESDAIDEIVRKNTDASGNQRYSKEFIQNILSSNDFAGKLISTSKGVTTQYSIKDPGTALMSKILSGNLSNEDLKTLMSFVTKNVSTTSQLPATEEYKQKVGEETTVAEAQKKEEESVKKAEEDKKELKKQYIVLLREEESLLEKIDKLNHQIKETQGRGEDVTALKKDLSVYRRAKNAVRRKMRATEFSVLKDENGNIVDDDILLEQEIQGAKRKSKKSLLGIGDADNTLKAFERYATKRMKLESEIEQAQLKANTTVGNEKKAWENVVALKQQSLKASEDTYEILKKQAVGVDKDRAQEIIDAADQQKAILSAQKFAGNRGNRTIFDVIKSDIQRATMRITDFGLAARVLNTARKEIQQVYQNILKLDEAMTNLRIVTGSNTKQAKSMMNAYNDLAMQLGTTTQAVAQSAAEWLRQGYSVSEANELIKSSTYLSRLGFMDMNQSVTALTSVMKGFRIEAADSMDIVDKLTQLDAKYATTAGDIATALSRTSAVAREAGLDLDQTAAALTTMIDVSQQDASSVGNAFRTILARYGNVKATAFTSLVGDSDDVDDTNKSINDIEKVLGAIGIKIRSSSIDMRDFDDVMDELADKWVTLTDVEKNAVSTALAGVRQRNIFGIYMENYDTYKQAISEAEKAEGTAARKMQAYNESVAYSINQLSAAWEGFTQKLEANGAVKLFFAGLKDLVENLGTRLAQIISTIVSLRSFKLTTDLKRLADFFGFEGTGTGRIKTGAKNIWSIITGKGEVNKAAREAEKYAQQKAGTYEEQSRNKIVNSNNRVVDALNRNADALDRNSNTRSAKRAAKSVASTQTPNTPPVKSWAVESGILNGKNVYKTADGKWKYGNRHNVDDAIVANIKHFTKTSVAPVAEASEKQEEGDVRLQRLKGRRKQIAIHSAATGLTAGVISGVSAEGDIQDKLVTGASTAITTGLLSAIPGVGTILGPILGPVLGGFFGKEINKLLKADEVARKQRVKDAKKQLEAIKGIGNSVTGLLDLNKKDQALWDSDDWKQFNEQVKTINEALEKSELGDRIINLGDSTQTLSEYFEEAARTGNKNMLARVEAEKIRFEAEKTYTAGEQDRYTLQKEINENQKKLANLDDDEISKKKELNAAIKAAKAEIEDYSEALKKGYMQASFYSSGVGTMESYDIGNATLDRVIMQIAREWAKDSPDIFAGNQLTSDARSDIISYLREQSGYSSLFKNDTKNVRDMLNAEKAVENLRTTLGMSQKQLKEFVNSKDLSEIADKFGATGDALYKIIDQVNLVDEDGISTIAHAMNMTIEQFREANSEGAFDWLTTDVAIGGLDKLNEKLATFNELLLAASENSLFSQENINKIVSQYPTLLKKIDEETGKISVSMDNVQENLVDILAGGESLRKVYAGFFSRDIATSAEKWDVFISSIREDIKKDSALDSFRDEIFKQTNYSGFLKVYEEHKDELESYNQSFIEYAKSLFSTDVFDTQQEILTKYATSTLETEISNLESIRDSLDDINKQREKEIELIKAKEALENASKEKKRVYRAGVGFVYTTDQEAVKSAQEKVDELERQRDKDDIQYQIDSLQQQKEILENIKDNEQLKALQETAKDTLDALGVNGALVTAILSGSKEEFNAVIKSGLDKDISEKATDVNNEIASEKEKAYYEAKAELDAFQQGKVVTGYGKKKDKDGNEIDDYASPIVRDMTPEELEIYGGMTPKQLSENKNSPFYSAGEENEKQLTGAVESAITEWGAVDKTAKDKVEKSTALFEKQDYKTSFLMSNPQDNYDNKKDGFYGLFSVSNEPIIDISDRIDGNIKKFRYALQSADGTMGDWESFSFDVAKDGSIEKQISNLKGPAVIANLDDRPNTVFYKGSDGSYYQMYGLDNTMNQLDEGKAAGNSKKLWAWKFVNGEPYILNVPSGVSSEINRSNINKGRELAGYPEATFASGTLSAPGGRSLINENGLESIITPSGTITSLPAKSGIIPADLTRNLWALGEVAPNLIARLGGNSLQTNNSNSSTDNSINIQNLDATFNTQSDFDGHRFLTDLRNQVILTANNH